MPAPTRITIEARGQKWSGHYRIDGKTLRLESAYGSWEAAVGRRKPELVAKELMEKAVTSWRTDARA